MLHSGQAEITNVGFIGVGWHSEQSHLDFWAQAPDCNVVALADLSVDRMRQMDDKFGLGARHTTKWEEVVADPDIDAVFIMTPDRQHAQQMVAALAMNKHVFCEKPVADNMADYELVSLALAQAESRRDRAGRKLVATSCHPRRYDPPFVMGKHFLDDSALLARTFELPEDTDFGEVAGMDFRFRYSHPFKTGLHESLMYDHLNHEIDLENFYFGFSGLRKALKLNDGPTAYGVSAVRDDGIELNFRGSRKLGRHRKVYQEEVRIDFTKGMLSIDTYAGTATLVCEDTGMPPKTIRHDVFKTDYDTRFTATNSHFLQAIRDHETPYLTADEIRLNTLAAIALHATDEAIAVRL